MHDVEGYIRGVESGKVLVCDWTGKAVARHTLDLEDGPDRGLWFDVDAAQHAIDFFGFLHHSKGEWSGKIFKLEPWQQFILWVLFGWKRSTDGARRFRTCYVEVPRKNGKSTFVAGIGLYLLIADDEPGAEIYSAATKREQARIVHSEATRMVLKSPHLRDMVGVYRDNLHLSGKASKFEPLGSDANSLDGLNIHGAIVDELHAHKNSSVWDVLETATGSRRQPVMIAITTAGTDQFGICFEQRTYLTKILDRTVADDTYFGIIWTIDDDDDWRDPAVWRKANPNWEVSIKPDDMERLCLKAKVTPRAKNNYLTKRLNVWTTQETLWMNMEMWNLLCDPFDHRELHGVECFGGLDLATTSDIAAFVMVFRKNDKIYVIGRYYLPRDTAIDRSKKANVPYDVWARQGKFVLTEGNVTDYNVIQRDIIDFSEKFNIKEIAYDRFNASQLVINLEGEGATMVPFGQGFVSMSAPTRELEKLVLTGELQHGGDTVLTWMVSNVSIQEDDAGNIKPSKKRSFEKIDGAVALIMAIGRMMVHSGPSESIYEGRGLLVL